MNQPAILKAGEAFDCTTVDDRHVRLSRAEIVSLARQARLSPEDLHQWRDIALPNGESLRVYTTPNDPKYGVVIYVDEDEQISHVRVANAITGTIIPDDVPIFTLIAWDKYASETVGEYCKSVVNASDVTAPLTSESASEQHGRFLTFRNTYPRRMKAPT